MSTKAGQLQQTRFVAGLPWYLIGRRLNLNGVFGQYVLHKAKKNLVSQYKAFGLKERFEDSAELFATHIGTVPNIPDSRIKKHSDRPTAEEISSETRSQLCANNKLDIALYDFATQCFDRQKRQLT